MPALDDPQREAFCRHVARGVSEGVAALHVYGRRGPDTVLKTLTRSEAVANRIAELRGGDDASA